MTTPLITEAGLKWVSDRLDNNQIVDSIPFDCIEHYVKVEDGVAKIAVTYLYENQAMLEMPLVILRHQGVVVLRGMTGSIAVSVGHPDKEQL
jgi:hypothetical protein